MNDVEPCDGSETTSNDDPEGEHAHRDTTTRASWNSGAGYEAYVGRWSGLVAAQLLGWLAPAPHLRWLDVGCGTGRLSRAILSLAQPSGVAGIDRSPEFVAYAQETVVDPRITFQVGDAQALPFASGTFDYAVSGLVLNFVPQPQRMVEELLRVVRRDGTVALYVWDYSAGMEFMRIFWDVAAEFDPATADLDEGRRFSVTNPDALRTLFDGAGASASEVRAIDVPTAFESFNDFWDPFLAGQGPAPGYVGTLTDTQRERLRAALHDRLPIATDGSIALTARAWAVRATA